MKKLSDELTVMRVCEIPSRTSTHLGHSMSPRPPPDAAMTCMIMMMMREKKVGNLANQITYANIFWYFALQNITTERTP